MPTVSDRLLKILLSTPDLPETIQWRVFREGEREKSGDLLRSLARYPGLHPSVDSAIGDVDKAVVRAAWAARAGRSHDRVLELIASEKRVTVLTALAEQPGLPEEALLALVAKLSGTRLLAIVGNESMPKGVRKAAARRFAETLSAGVRLTAEHISTIYDASDYAPMMLSKCSNAELASACLAVTDPTPRDLDRVVAMVKKEANSDSSSLYRAIERVESLVAALNGHALSEKNRQDLHDAVKSSKTFASSWGGARILSAVNGLTAGTMQRCGAIQAVREAKDGAEALGILKRAGAGNLGTLLPLLQAAYTNDNIDADSFAQILEKHPQGWQEHRLLAKARTTPAKAAVLYCEAPWVSIDAIISGQDDPQEFVAQALHRYAKTDSQSRPIPGELLASPHLTGAMIAELPVDVLLLLGDEHLAKAAAALADKLTEAAASESQWETLRTLSESYAGTLEDLLATAKSL